MAARRLDKGENAYMHEWSSVITVTSHVTIFQGNYGSFFIFTKGLGLLRYTNDERRVVAPSPLPPTLS